MSQCCPFYPFVCNWCDVLCCAVPYPLATINQFERRRRPRRHSVSIEVHYLFLSVIPLDALHSGRLIEFFPYDTIHSPNSCQYLYLYCIHYNIAIDFNTLHYLPCFLGLLYKPTTFTYWPSSSSSSSLSFLIVHLFKERKKLHFRLLLWGFNYKLALDCHI